MFKPKPGYRCVAWSPDGDLVVFIYQAKGSIHRWYCLVWDRRSDSRIQLPTIPSVYTIPYLFKCIIVPTQPYVVYFFRKDSGSYIWAQPSSRDWQTCDYPWRGILTDTGFYDAVSYKPRDAAAGLIFLSKEGVLHSNPKAPSDPPSQLMLPNQTIMYQRRLVPMYNQEVPDAECFLLERKLPCRWRVWKIDLSRRKLTSINDLGGLTVFLTSEYSIAYRSDSELDRNCIYFTTEEKEVARRLSIFVFRLDDQSLSLVPNQHHYRFPFCLAQITDSGLPWMSYLKFVDKDKQQQQQQNTIVAPTSAETVTATYNSMRSSCSTILDESCDLATEDNFCCSLPEDLQRLIVDLLPSTMDYANFRLVSKNWSQVPPICWEPDFSNLAPTQLPWLMLAGEKDQHASFIDPVCSMRYFISNEELLDSEIRYSNDGWLLVTQGMSTVFFFEPISKTRIKLIDIPKDFNIHVISFSSSPTSTSDWVVIAISCTIENVYVAHLRPNYDKWIICLCENEFAPFGGSSGEFIPYGCSPIFHDDDLFIVNVFGKLARLSFMDSESKMHCSTYGQRIPFKFSDFHRWFLVSCGGNLYMVIIGLLGKFIEVHKLQDGEWPIWEEVKDIGNFSIFISQTSSFAVPAMERAKRNTINFPLFEEGKHLLYKLDEGVFKVHQDGQSTGDIYQRKELFNGTWVQPKATKAYRK